MARDEQSLPEKLISGVPPALRAVTGQWGERLLSQHARLPSSGEHLATLARLVATSEFAGSVLLRNWDWFQSALARGDFRKPPAAREIDDFVTELRSGDSQEGAIKGRLREFRNRRLLHILWRNIDGSADLAEALMSLSQLADGMIAAAEGCSRRLLEDRFGTPRDANGDPLPLVVLAMGKLGGYELNFSSDIDLVFLYRGEGESDGARKLSAHEYFTRQARLLIMLLEEVTADGFVYRVDTRLRPFGESGPPVTSFVSLESYLLQHGRGWERYAYIKARVVTPPGDADVVRELMHDIIEPFVYRRYLDYGVFESLRDMKSLISAEVKKRELASNIKLGPGGIREIEFIAQSLQLVRGGSNPALRSPQLQKVLPALAGKHGLAAAAVRELLQAYVCLRRFENALQAINDRQRHDIPRDPVEQARLALALGHGSWESLHEELLAQRACVSRHFDNLLFGLRDDASASGLSRALVTLWESDAGEDEWQAALHAHGYRDAGELASTLVKFAKTSIGSRMDKTAERRLGRLMPLLLRELENRQHPARTLERNLRIVSQILRRSAYLSLLIENPAVLGRLVALCEESAYLAEEIARYPQLLDELFDPRLSSASITAAAMRADLDDRLRNIDEADSERRIETLGQFQRANLFRIAVADHSGNLPVMKVSDRLTELAELVLVQALDTAWSDLTKKHGFPICSTPEGERPAGFGIVAYGKLGGMELSYRSDLDLVFLHDSAGERQQTDGRNALDNSVFFSRLATRLTHFLTTQTASGALYEVDTRLRPSGRSGLLVSSVDGFERYQEDNAWTWEHQALLRSRPVAGDAVIAREFERIRSETLRFRVRRAALRDDVLSMRDKMRTELDCSSKDNFDLKQGSGGIADIEFLVQYLVLQNAAEHPAVIHYPDNIRQLGTLGAAGCLAERDVVSLQQIYKAYRLCLHRLALDEQAPLVAHGQFADERQFVAELWQREFS
ncbi:MAG: bifunctional [glutamate--ammonia ligase]-adenylyl-L-tyrosine phosphorylase/[glutamate--ammonia-ligase] adenylyltransferase [Woeseiaceae bacterium]|nr:bifunctional [glutamate--ammonia ligase]-adenylyl-L-tyrosine phosphorylase/[glutamate--ammonia-ligase] adenylyltransferase [Woeseiaceae bacterium]